MGYKKHITGTDKPISKYKGIYPVISPRGGYVMWIASKIHKGKKYRKVLQTEKEAAFAYDKMCLSLGLDPVNILKRKL